MNLLEFKKYSMGEEQAWCPGFSWNVGRTGMILWTDIRMVMLDLEYEYPSWWWCRRWLVWKGLWRGWKLGKDRTIFLKASLEQEELSVGEDSLSCTLAGAEAIKTALAAPSPCGCALAAAFRNALQQGLCFLSCFSTCPGNVFSLESQIHFITHRSKRVLSAFCGHVCNGLARCGTRASSLCQNKSHLWAVALTWHCTVN